MSWKQTGQTWRKEKVIKRLIFHNEEIGERVFIVDIGLFNNYGELRLCEVLLHLRRKGLQTTNYSFSIPDLNICIEAGDQCQVPFNLIKGQKEIYFEMNPIDREPELQDLDELYTPLQAPNENEIAFDEGLEESESLISLLMSHSSLESQEQSSQGTHEEEEKHKNISSKWADKISEFDKRSKLTEETEEIKKFVSKKKEQEKTVYEALCKVKLWREIHEICGQSLKNSALRVGLSKKTLDDYYLVFRAGEEHGYDFEENLSEKIGHLRSFIRKQPIKLTGRLPKEVKSFCLVPEFDLTPFMPPSVDESRLDHIQEEKINKADQEIERLNENREMIEE